MIRAVLRGLLRRSANRSLATSVSAANASAVQSLRHTPESSCVVLVSAERRFGWSLGKLVAAPDLICVRASRPAPGEAEVTGSDSEAVVAPRAPTGRKRSRALAPRSRRTIWAPSGEIDPGRATRASGRKTSGPLSDTADSATGTASVSAGSGLAAATGAAWAGEGSTAVGCGSSDVCGAGDGVLDAPEGSSAPGVAAAGSEAAASEAAAARAGNKGSGLT